MKYGFAPVVLAATLAVGACAHINDSLSAAAPSQLTVAEIDAELAAISGEWSKLGQGGDRLRSLSTPSIVQTPVVLHVSDSNGVPLTTFSPGDSLNRFSSSRFQSSSRPFGYERMDALAKRQAALYAELNRRGQPQQ